MKTNTQQKRVLARASKILNNIQFIAASLICIFLAIYGISIGTRWEILVIWLGVTLALCGYTYKLVIKTKVIHFNHDFIYVTYSGFEDRWRYEDIALINRTTTRMTVLGMSFRKFKIVHSNNETVYFYTSSPENFESMLKILMSKNKECKIFI